MTTSLAVRHRPHTWDTVAGQQHLVAVLFNDIKRRKALELSVESQNVALREADLR